jgi:hypothetical protein
VDFSHRLESIFNEVVVTFSFQLRVFSLDVGSLLLSLCYIES